MKGKIQITDISELLTSFQNGLVAYSGLTVNHPYVVVYWSKGHFFHSF